MTKLKKNIKKLHYETKINYIKNYSKKLWSTLNDILGWGWGELFFSFIELDGSFITKSTDIANYFNDLFIGKISKLNHDMPATNADTTHSSISDQIMKDKHCFEFRKVSVEEVKKVLSVNNNKSLVSDNVDGKLRIIASDIAIPICLVFNLRLIESVCPLARREAKVIPLSKNSKAPFTGSNS